MSSTVPSPADRMQAVVVTDDGPRLQERPVPAPRPNEVLVRVRAAALNRVDLQLADGHTHGSRGGPGSVLGIEWAGTVEAVGAEVPTQLARGDAVMCSGSGGYAGFAVADWGRVHPLPQGFRDFGEAAALPVALQTAHEALTASGQFRAGQSVLVLGASSAIGLMALQVARHLGASMVIGGARDPRRFPFLRDGGMHHGVDLRDPDWPQQVRRLTNGEGADLVIDMVMGEGINQALAATRVLGTVVNVGRMGGSSAPVDFELHAERRIRLVGASFRSRTLDEVRTIAANMRRDLWPAVAARQLALPVVARFPLADHAKALDAMRSNVAMGKIVLEVAP